MQDSNMTYADKGIARFMVPYLERQRVLFPVIKDDRKIAGVHAYVYTPATGIAAANKDRVLINLHGGGFSGCWLDRAGLMQGQNGSIIATSCTVVGRH
jgi:monoterpene epsilon-lactone hydrolase